MNPSLDAIYYCYKNPYATYLSLESFRNYHPTSTIYLISDNGYDYTEMAKHFNCLYIHLYENTNCTGYRANGISPYNSIDCFMKFLVAWRKIFAHSTAAYIIKLEDDVQIQGTINTSILKGAINGPTIFTIPNAFFTTYYALEAIEPPVNKYFSGHGGCVYDRVKFLHYTNNPEIIQNSLNVYIACNLIRGYIHDDVMFSILAILHNYTIEDNPYHMEVDTEKDTKQREHCTILHQVKQNDSKVLPEELKYLVRM